MISIPIIIAFFAAFLTSLQLLPQIYHTYVVKTSKGLSEYSVLLTFFGNILWLIHALYISDIALICAGGFNLLTALALVVMYFFYKKK